MGVDRPRVIHGRAVHRHERCDALVTHADLTKNRRQLRGTGKRDKGTLCQVLVLPCSKAIFQPDVIYDRNIPLPRLRDFFPMQVQSHANATGLTHFGSKNAPHLGDKFLQVRASGATVVGDGDGQRREASDRRVWVGKV